MKEPDRKLPKGWRWAKLGDVTRFLDNMRRPVNEAERQERINGKPIEQLFPYYGANGQVGWIDDYIFDEELVLLAEDGGSFGSNTEPIAYRVTGKIWVNNHAHVLQTISNVTDIDYLYYSIFIRPDILPLVSGTTRSKLNQTLAKEIPIPLPPLPVQERIAQILQKADEIRRKRKEATNVAESIIQAIFIDMFGDPEENPKGFPIVPLGNIIEEGPQNGLYKPQDAYGRGTKIVRTKNYYAGALTSLEDFWKLDCTPEEIEKYCLKPGDIIINRVNSAEYVGKCALIPEINEKIVFESNTMRLRVNSSLVYPEYVVAFLCTRSCRSQIKAIGARRRAVNMVSINQKDVNGLKLPLAPKKLQAKFIDSIRQYTALSRNPVIF